MIASLNLSSLPLRSMQELLKEHVVSLEDLPLSYNKPEGVCEPELALSYDSL